MCGIKVLLNASILNLLTKNQQLALIPRIWKRCNMFSRKLNNIKTLQRVLLGLPVVVFLFVIFNFNIEIRANQITLFVESGSVEIMNALDDSQVFQKVTSKYTNVTKRSTIRTNNGTAYLLLPGKSLISLDVFSSISLDNVAPGSFSVSSSYGRTWHKVNNAVPDEIFKYEINTPTARLASVGTEFELQVDKDYEVLSQVTLVQGEALVSNSKTNQNETVNEGKLAKVAESDTGVVVQDLVEDVVESDFFQKNQIISKEIDKIEPTASLDTYRETLEEVTATANGVVAGAAVADTDEDQPIAESTPVASVEPVATTNAPTVSLTIPQSTDDVDSIDGEPETDESDSDVDLDNSDSDSSQTDSGEIADPASIPVTVPTQQQSADTDDVDSDVVDDSVEPDDQESTTVVVEVDDPTLTIDQLEIDLIDGNVVVSETNPKVGEPVISSESEINESN